MCGPRPLRPRSRAGALGSLSRGEGALPAFADVSGGLGPRLGLRARTRAHCTYLRPADLSCRFLQRRDRRGAGRPSPGTPGGRGPGGAGRGGGGAGDPDSVETVAAPRVAARGLGPGPTWVPGEQTRVPGFVPHFSQLSVWLLPLQRPGRARAGCSLSRTEERTRAEAGCKVPRTWCRRTSRDLGPWDCVSKCWPLGAPQRPLTPSRASGSRSRSPSL